LDITQQPPIEHNYRKGAQACKSGKSVFGLCTKEEL